VRAFCTDGGLTEAVSGRRLLETDRGTTDGHLDCGWCPRDHVRHRVHDAIEADEMADRPVPARGALDCSKNFLSCFDENGLTGGLVRQSRVDSAFALLAALELRPISVGGTEDDRLAQRLEAVTHDVKPEMFGLRAPVKTVQLTNLIRENTILQQDWNDVLACVERKIQFA
jgi:hypothetical protein